MGVLNTPALSVVVPVYNVQPYLRDCIDSLIAQQLESVEIIMVEDVSTDQTRDLAEELAQEHAEKGVRLLCHPENRGLASARNTGLAEASGKYVTFVDSDDLVPERAFERMMRMAEAADADVVVGDFRGFVEKDGQVEFRRSAGLRQVGVFDYEVAGRLEHLPRTVYAVSAWAKLFRRSYLSAVGLIFEPGVKFAEDQPFVISAYASAQTIAICPEVVYHYRQELSHSLMGTKFGPGRFERLRDLILGNLKKLSGWPRYYYSRRVLDYEIFQNVRRLGTLSWGEGAEAFEYLREAMLAVDPEVVLRFVSEKPRFRQAYMDLSHNNYTLCRLRQTPLGGVVNLAFS